MDDLLIWGLGVAHTLRLILWVLSVVASQQFEPSYKQARTSFSAAIATHLFEMHSVEHIVCEQCRYLTLSISFNSVP